MQKWLIYLVSALVVLSMAFLLLRSLISPEATRTSMVGTKEIAYTSPSGLWKANFPGEPKYSTDVYRDDLGLPTVTIEGSVLDLGDELYVVRLYHFHDVNPIELKTFFDNVVATWTKKFPNLKVVRQNQIRFQDQPAISFSLAEDNLEMLGVVFQREDYFYLINWVGNMNNKEVEKVGESHFNAFLDSFSALSATTP